MKFIPLTKQAPRVHSAIFIFTMLLVLCNAISTQATAREGKIAFLGATESYWQVFVVNADDFGLLHVTSSPVDKAHLSWSFDSRKLLFNTNRGELFIIDTETTKEKVLKIGVTGMTDAVWSPDGKSILFSLSIANSIDANDIWEVEISSGKRKRLTNMKHMQHDPAWSYDEKKVIFVSGAGGQDHNLFVIEPTTGATQQLTAGQRYHFEPACSINDEIAFSSNRTDDYEIWVCDFEGKKFSQITYSPGMDGQPTWSPDGKEIAFVSSRGGYPAIWVINRDGSNAHQVSPDGMRCRGPVWSR